jgi:hypothetical protein
MAILDNLTLFSDSQDLAIAVSTANSTDYIDLEAASVTTSADAPSGVAVDKAKGVPVELWCRVDESFTSAGAGTLKVILQTSAASNFSGSINLVTSKVFTKTEAAAGKRLLPRVLPNDCLRYIRLTYTIGTADMTAGKVTAGIVSAQQDGQ